MSKKHLMWIGIAVVAVVIYYLVRNNRINLLGSQAAASAIV